MVTVFTPIYNRRYIVGELYESLKRQSSKNFEWIIVDDGSTDDFQSDVSKWLLEGNAFPIYYRYVSNGGKHRAINIGVQMAHSDAFFVVDSDDFISSDAIEFIDTHFEEIKNDDSFAGISGLRNSLTDNSVIGGEPCFSGYVDATNLERGRYGLLRDKAEVYKTSVLKRFPFPEFENENFLTEGIVWNQIAYEGLKIRWYNKTLYYCEYIRDGLTKNGLELYKKNPIGWAKSLIMERKYKYWDENTLFNNVYRYYEALHKEMPKDEMCKQLEISSDEYDMLFNKWQQNISEISNIFLKNQISSAALYGMGNNGKRILLYLNELQIDVKYVIDRNFSEVNFEPVYNLEMDLPTVESVCVTLKKSSLEIIQDIRRKLPKTLIWTLQDISTGVW